jgi:gamma-aminobutyric acid type B receptor
MLTYSSVIFLGLDSRLTSIQAFPYVCAARAWLLMAGFSLAFGAMFSKTWRVHSIFTDVKLNKKVQILIISQVNNIFYRFFLRIILLNTFLL